MTDAVNQEAGAEVPAQEPKVQLTLNHIEIVVNLIKVTQARGAYKPEEMEVVGKLYSDLSKFIKQSVAQEAQAEGEAQAEAETGTDAGEAKAE